MKVVMVMFDSLNRHMLPPYNADTFVQAPNFSRLAERTAQFNRSYVCSMPCMPARRDLHTGRPNFLHTSWGPLQPFDDSVPQMLAGAGTSTHLISDHQHYWEDGGATYHSRYSTWQFHRGQEGDPWMGMAADPPNDNTYGRNAGAGDWHRQDRVNRLFMRREQDQPQSKTFNAGLDFIHRNHDQDNWFLQIETFDPHEPFFTQRKYKDLYAEHYDKWRRERGPLWDWPAYKPVDEPAELVEHMRYEYAALVSMCDAKLGDVLDAFDAHGLWDDTMLIVWTDHGFMLGEHDAWAKMWMGFYEETAHTPFWVWDPRSRQAGVTREALIQPSIDLGPTLLEFFGQKPTEPMTGKALSQAIADDTPVRDAAIYGQHGMHVNVTDGRYVYWRGIPGEQNTPLFDYTLMPTHMRTRFSPDELQPDRVELAEPFDFTKGCRPLKIQSGGMAKWDSVQQTRLYDLRQDPQQTQPIEDARIEQRMIDHMTRLMAECEAPPEQYERLGLGGVTA